MAVLAADIRCEIREVLLRDKPASMLEASPKGTVPVLVLPGRVIDESLDVMNWALEQHDPQQWLTGSSQESRRLLRANDGRFKHHLDRFKYSARHDADPQRERDEAAVFIAQLESRLSDAENLLDDKPRQADVAIFPFVRQFAGVDRAYWEASPFPNTRRWLQTWCASPLFARCMHKHPPWQPSDEPIFFPPPAA